MQLPASIVSWCRRIYWAIDWKVEGDWKKSRVNWPADLVRNQAGVIALLGGVFSPCTRAWVLIAVTAGYGYGTFSSSSRSDAPRLSVKRWLLSATKYFDWSLQPIKPRLFLAGLDWKWALFEAHIWEVLEILRAFFRRNEVFKLRQRFRAWWRICLENSVKTIGSS